MACCDVCEWRRRRREAGSNLTGGAAAALLTLATTGAADSTRSTASARRRAAMRQNRFCADSSYPARVASPTHARHTPPSEKTPPKMAARALLSVAIPLGLISMSTAWPARSIKLDPVPRCAPLLPPR